MLAHVHRRKRSAKNLEPYPARTVTLRTLDRVIYAVGVIGPLMTIPQLVRIYSLRDASGVSALTWGAYALFDLPWIVYGIVHDERPITFSYVLWFFFNSAVFIGAVLYGN